MKYSFESAGRDLLESVGALDLQIPCSPQDLLIPQSSRELRSQFFFFRKSFRLLVSFPSSTELTIRHIATRMNQAPRAQCCNYYILQCFPLPWRSARIVLALQLQLSRKGLGAAESGVGKSENK